MKRTEVKEDDTPKRPKLILDDWQNQVLEHKGNFLLCTGRQVGKTTIFAYKAAQYMIKNKNARIIVVSLTEDQAQLIIVMILTYLEQNVKRMICAKSKKPTKSKIQLKNGSQVISRPIGNTGDAVRGFTGDVLIIDEASRMPETMWAASKPTLLTTGGEIWMCSTPFGKQGYFYDCYQNKDNRYKVFHISSEKVINERKINDSWTIEQRTNAIRFLEEEKRDMGELSYAQEYLGKFIDELRQFFSDELIDRVCTQPKGSHNETADYFLGCDIARLGRDECADEIIQRIDQDNLIHIESIVTIKQLTTQTYDRIIKLNKVWNFVKIGIDAGSGSLGVGILDFLLRNPEVSHKVIAVNNLSRPLDRFGERKINIMKVDLYDNLRALMEKMRIKLLDDEKVRLSLKSVQYEYVKKEGELTKIRIFGNYTHIAEGLVRAAWLANQKHIKTFIDWI